MALLLITTLMLGGIVALVAFYCREFHEVSAEYTRRWFVNWFVRGIGAPTAIWLILNWGPLPFLPPLNPFVANLRAKGFYAEALVFQTLFAAVPIVSYWGALSFGWFLTSLFKRAKNTDDFIIALIVWGPVLLLLAWIFWAFSGWYGVGCGAVLWAWPLTQYLLANANMSVPAPAYSRAIGKIKFGKYAEAEMAIIGELEKVENDFDGWMMLAELYARQYHDLSEAERTIYEICGDSATTPSQVSLALQKLADWYLHFGSDPVSARRVLEDLCERVTGTHLAFMARQRINQIPASRAEFDEQSKPQKIAMPALNDSLDEPDAPHTSGTTRQAAMISINPLIEKLNADPNDIAAREKLAKLFADQLEKFELAIEQVELLLGIPEQPERKVAEWLALLAAWQIKQFGEGPEAKKTLERLIHEFPHSAQAFAAQRRLNLINMNSKMRPVRPMGKNAESKS
jgi:hypothetical protein